VAVAAAAGAVQVAAAALVAAARLAMNTEDDHAGHENGGAVAR